MRLSYCDTYLLFIDSFVIHIHLKIHLKAFSDFKKKQKCVRSNVFWYVKVCIFWKCIQYIIHWDKTQILNKFVSDKLNGAKYVPFFFASCNLSQFDFWFAILIWGEANVSIKLCVRFSIFDSASFLWKFISLFNEVDGSLDSLKRYNSFQNLNNRKVT